MRKHSDSPYLDSRIDNAQTKHYQDGCADTLYRPKYVCWDCRRTFKPTVPRGTKVTHTGQPEAHGIVETTDGRPFLGSGRDQSVRKHQITSGRAFARHPGPDSRIQTVWAVHDMPHKDGVTHPKDLDLWAQGPNEGIANFKWKNRNNKLSKYQDYAEHRIQRLHKPLRSHFAELNSYDPLFPPDCSTEAEVDAWLAEERKRLPSHRLPPRVVVTCCPSCGQVGTRIGSNFRPPPQKDTKAWAEAKRRTIDEGEQWNFCLTGTQMAEMQELFGLARARYAVENAEVLKHPGVTAAPSHGEVRERTRTGTSKRDRQREQELRTRLGLAKSKIYLGGEHRVEQRDTKEGKRI